MRASSSRAAISVIDLDLQMLYTSGVKSTTSARWWCKGTRWCKGTAVRAFSNQAEQFSSWPVRSR